MALYMHSGNNTKFTKHTHKEKHKKTRTQKKTSCSILSRDCSVCRRPPPSCRRRSRTNRTATNIKCFEILLLLTLKTISPAYVNTPVKKSRHSVRLSSFAASRLGENSQTLRTHLLLVLVKMQENYAAVIEEDHVAVAGVPDPPVPKAAALVRARGSPRLPHVPRPRLVGRAVYSESGGRNERAWTRILGRFRSL